MLLARESLSRVERILFFSFSFSFFFPFREWYIEKKKQNAFVLGYLGLVVPNSGSYRMDSTFWACPLGSDYHNAMLHPPSHLASTENSGYRMYRSGSVRVAAASKASKSNWRRWRWNRRQEGAIGLARQAGRHVAPNRRLDYMIEYPEQNRVSIISMNWGQGFRLVSSLQASSLRGQVTRRGGRGQGRRRPACLNLAHLGMYFLPCEESPLLLGGKSKTTRKEAKR
ncbi:hypothetical protein BZA05DRAFT_39013 [Tricharina praecox]|uniref:uncharacterized protein n=1 Tax=Tricharina praecox TaxID=43433 RepID=UPI00221FA315|nr:uncharacterized protein BZA05DRAFT_39013 [Tricharina praecox]KAI5852216.1 hypothetical protein BZA05DRAFT_39013 [Tricharina praecox]